VGKLRRQVKAECRNISGWKRGFLAPPSIALRNLSSWRNRTSRSSSISVQIKSDFKLVFDDGTYTKTIKHYSSWRTEKMDNLAESLWGLWNRRPLLSGWIVSTSFKRRTADFQILGLFQITSISKNFLKAKNLAGVSANCLRGGGGGRGRGGKNGFLPGRKWQLVLFEHQLQIGLNLQWQMGYQKSEFSPGQTTSSTILRTTSSQNHESKRL